MTDGTSRSLTLAPITVKTGSRLDWPLPVSARPPLPFRATSPARSPVSAVARQPRSRFRHRRRRQRGVGDRIEPYRDLHVRQCRIRSIRHADGSPGIPRDGSCRVDAVHVYLLVEHLVDHRHVDPCREWYLQLRRRGNQPMSRRPIEVGGARSGPIAENTTAVGRTTPGPLARAGCCLLTGDRQDYALASAPRAAWLGMSSSSSPVRRA
jgi:hypothetical protein